MLAQVDQALLYTATKLGAQSDRVLFVVAMALLVGMGAYMLRAFLKKIDDKDTALLDVTRQYSNDSKAVGSALDKISEAVKDNTEAMKSSFLHRASALVLGLCLLSGCGSFSGLTSTQNLAALAEVAAYTGASYEIRRDPGSLAAFQTAHEAVKKLIDGQNYDPAALAQALSGLHIRELKGSRGQLIITSTIVLWDAYVPDITAIDKAAKVLPILQALDRGLGKAIADAK